MNLKRVGRFLVCLVLVCVILVNCSPIRAEAVVTEAVITGAAATGVAAVLFSMAMGVVFVDLTWQAIERMGAQMSSSVKAWGDANGKSNEVNEWLSGISISDALDSVLSIPADLMSGVTSWVAELINGGSIAVPKDGITVCLDYALLGFGPMPDTLYSYDLIYLNTSGFYFVTCQRPIRSLSSGQVCTTSTSVTSRAYIVYQYSDGIWSKYKSGNCNQASNTNWCSLSEVVWVSSDLKLYNSTDVYIYAADSAAAYDYVSPSGFVGTIPGEILKGTTTADDVEILTIDYGIVFESGGSGDDENQDSDYRVLAGLNSLAGQLSDGSLTYDDYMEQTKVEQDIPDVGGNDPVKASTLKQWLDTIRMTLFSGFTELKDAVVALPQAITTPIINALEYIFVPREDFVSDKVSELRKEFAFADTLITGGQMIADTFNVSLYDSSAPIIYIDLGATRGDYDIGGKVPFIDLTWYEEYKPTVDMLLSSFLWVVFIWKLFQKAPGIISGMPGDFMMEGLHQLNMDVFLPSRSLSLEKKRRTFRGRPL